MKYTSTFIFGCLSFFTASSQSFKLTTQYSLGLPQDKMASNIQAAHGGQLGLMYQLPGPFNNLAVGVETGVGLYAHKRVDQTFWFDSNTSTVLPVNYNSNVFNFNFQARYNLSDEHKHDVVPYVNAKAGVYKFYSNINIEDPDDPDGCKALVRKNIMKDNTYYWSAGAGVQIDPAVFSKHGRETRVRIDLGANIIRGGRIEYINTKDLEDATNMMPEEGAKPLNVQFINVGTQQIHEHSVAQVHRSFLRMMEIRAGIVILIGV